MDKEVVQLEKLLQQFREDLEKGKLVKKKEQIIIEYTALRNLAATIMEDAKVSHARPIFKKCCVSDHY